MFSPKEASEHFAKDNVASELLYDGLSADMPLMEATGRSDTRFLHCLPAYHDTNTPAGKLFHDQHGLCGIEVSDDVFESERSVVFQESENRLHTIKALLVATLCGEES